MQVGALDFDRRLAFHCHEGLKEEKLQRQFAPSAVCCRREGLEELGPFFEVFKRLRLRIAPKCILPRVLEIAHGPVDISPLLEVHSKGSGDLSGSLPIGGFQPLPE